MDCYKNLIGVKSCDLPTPPISGMYVNDLEGISSEMVHQISDSDQENLIGVWEAVENRAILRFKEHFKILLEEFSKGWTDVLYKSDRPNIRNPFRYLPVFNGLSGQFVILPSNEYSTVSFKSLRFVSKTAVANHTITLHELVTGDLIATSTPFPVTVGYNEIDLSDQADFQNVKGKFWDSGFFIGIDTSTLELAETDPGCRCSKIDIYQDCGCSGGDTIQLGPLEFASGVTPTYKDAHENLSCKENGIIANIEANCDIENYLCEHVEHFKYAFWHIIGAEILNEKIMSPTIGFFTQTHTLETEELVKRFRKEAKSSLKRRAKVTTIDRVCVSCSPESSYSMASNIP